MHKKYLLDPNSIFVKINHAIANSVYIFDVEDSVLVWLSDRGQELVGLTLQDIQKLGPAYVEKIMHPDDLPKLIATIQNIGSIQDDKPILLEYRLRHPDGSFNWVHDRITVFSRKENGDVESVLGVVTLVNSLKRREQEQLKIIEKLNLSLSAANMGTWEWDLEKNVLHWDDRMYDIHDVDRATAKPPVEEVWARADRSDMEQVNLKVQEAAEKRQDFYVTYRTKYRNDEIHHIRVYGRFISSLNTNRMYGVAWDSTEEIKTEQEAAEAKARLISSTKMAALGEMSGGIAHEINNPLTVIQARAFQLNQMVEQNKLDPAKIKQAADSISRTADKIAKIIKSLRSFAREGTYDPFEVVPVNRLIEETLEFCRTRFYNHGVEIEVGPIDPDLEIECRVIQIEQVLLNLLNNSFDAIQNLDDRWIRVNVKDMDEEGIEIIVTDSGSGIAPDLQDQIMVPFFTTKEVGKGTGLGLSISTGIIRSHKGTLRLDPVSANTAFVVQLPKFQENLDH